MTLDVRTILLLMAFTAVPTALVLLAIAIVMGDAVRAAEENRAFV